MPTEVLYRKWRPQRFADVAGQEVVTRTLVNALARHKVSHAYLFSGPRGTGKTTTGRLLAKAINCERNAAGAADSPGEPCNECPSCVAFNEGRALDLVELDGASNRGIDEIRDLRDKANYAPAGGAAAHKVYLIDEVHMLTDPAFNALLKTLEEPPPHIVFILATTDAHKVPATILSRCQRHDFGRIPLSATIDRLAHIAADERISIGREGLELIARSATGSLRDAINLLEQVCDSYGKDASTDAVREALGLVGDARAADLARQALRGDLAGGLATISAVRDDGLDLRQFQREVVGRLRDLLLVHAGADTGGAWTPEQVETMRDDVEGVAREKMVQVLRLFSEADLRADPLSPLPLELALAASTLKPEAAAAPEPTAARPAAPPMRQPPRAAPARPAAAPARNAAPAARPAPATRDISNASPEQIAAMLGSTKPVIPPASEEAQEPAPATANGHDQPAAAAANGAPAADAVEVDTALEGLVDQMKGVARERSAKLGALLNGSCRAVSWQDGVLTLGFFEDKFHKQQVEETANRKVYEEIAASILRAPVSIRCIIAPRPARPLSRSPLVQHAVQNHGATIVSEE
ncbi:MAG TPA: DNA polymerase III subunit gamma/tau [Dehalococcoidia bacterium]|nr:DNA polymerase III subunit gamma/tau [Dehalococcoidia bacterium]